VAINIENENENINRMLVLTDDNEFLYQDADSGSVVRYNVAANTQTVFVNSSVFVSINGLVDSSAVFENRAV